MPLIKLHRKHKPQNTNGGEEEKILNLTKKFFDLPKELILIFSLNDLDKINKKELVVEIELKKRSEEEIHEYIEILKKELPHIDAISVKMFDEKNVFFES